MIKINLLPEEERAKKRRLPAIKIPQMGAVVPIVVLVLVASGVASMVTIQSREINQLRSEVAELELETKNYKPQLEKIRQITQKRQEVRARLDIIARLDRQRYYRVQLLDELGKSVPANMWLTNVAELNEHSFQVDGVTFSNFNVARFMQNLDATEHWDGSDLNVVQQGKIEDLNIVQFTLVTQTKP